MQINKEADFLLKGNKVIYPPVRTDGLELYYDVKGKKNSDLYKDKLLDMSGNKNHGTLENFNYKNLSGYQEDSELVFDGIDDTLKMPKLSGIDEKNFTYQLNNNILAFTGDEVKTVKNGDVEVGGRNLVLNTQGEHEPTIPGSRVYLLPLTNSSAFLGEELTFSFKAKSSNGTNIMYISIGTGGSTRNNITRDIIIPKEYKEFKYTFTASTSTDTTRLMIVAGTRWHPDNYGSITVTDIKLEKGNKATDWTPAPEDLLEVTVIKGNFLGDMEDIIDDHTRDEQSGIEVFTDKADDSLVRVEVDGKSYQHAGSGKNLMSLQGWDLRNNAYVDEDSGYIYSSFGNAAHSPYVKIKPNTDYTYSHYGYPHRATLRFLDINKNLITSETSWGGIGTLNSPDNAYYFRRLANDSSGQTELEGFRFQLEEGSTATEYELPAPTPDYPIEIHSLNDFDVVSQKSEGGVIDGVEIGGRNYIRNDKWQGVTGGSVNEVDGALVVGEITNSGSSGSPRIRNTSLDGVKLPKTTLLSFEAKADVSEEAYIDFRGKESMRSIFKYTPTTEWQQYSFTVDSDGMILSYLYFLICGGLGDKLYLRNVKVEFGTLHSSWTPAPEDIAESDNHPLIDKINLSLSEPLRSVGDVKDRLFRDSDGLWKIERNVGKVIFNGSENWRMSDFYNNERTINFGVGNVIPSYQKNINSNRFTKVPLTTAGSAVEGINNTRESNFRISIDRVRLETENLNGFKTWLDKNPTTVIYEIERTTIETLDQELQDKLNNLRSFQDSNYVYTVINDKTDILPSHISENLKPIIHTEFLAKDHFKENRTVNNLLIWNRSLEDDELLNQNKLFHERFNMRSNTVKGEPINQEVNLLNGGVFGHSLEQNYTIEI